MYNVTYSRGPDKCWDPWVCQGTHAPQTALMIKSVLYSFSDLKSVKHPWCVMLYHVLHKIVSLWDTRVTNKPILNGKKRRKHTNDLIVYWRAWRRMQNIWSSVNHMDSPLLFLLLSSPLQGLNEVFIWVGANDSSLSRQKQWKNLEIPNPNTNIKIFEHLLILIQHFSPLSIT